MKGKQEVFVWNKDPRMVMGNGAKSIRSRWIIKSGLSLRFHSILVNCSIAHQAMEVNRVPFVFLYKHCDFLFFVWSPVCFITTFSTLFYFFRFNLSV